MPIEIVVKTISNDSHRFEVEESILVSEFKTIIQNALDISAERQRLIYRGQVLQDERALQQYCIESGHTVHMVARPLNATPSASPSQPAERLSQRVGEGRLSGIFGAGGMAIQGDPLMALLGPLNGAGSLNELLQGAQRHSDPAAPTRNTQSLEHIRQSILTLHSLRASMPPTVFMPPGFSNDSTADVGGAVESPPKVFYLGQWIDVKDTVNQWLEATVMNVDLRERKVFVHYNGWPTHWDEWLDFDSNRISPFRTRTVHVNNSSLQCPTPNTFVSFARTTGRDDIRHLLPALLESYETLGTVLRQTVFLADQSLVDEPTIYDNTPNTSDGRIATEMPWDSFLSRETRSEQQHTGEYVGSRETLNATARFAELSRLLVPLMDRFGRVLTDTAAHLDIEYDPLQAVAAESINESTDQLSSLQPGEIDSSILEARHPVAVDAEPPNPSSVQIRHMNGAASRQNLERVEPTSTPDAGLASLLASNLPPSLRQLLQPRPPSPPPHRSYRQLINSPVGRAGAGINHLVDIHIHAILTPSRPSLPPSHTEPSPGIATVSNHDISGRNSANVAFGMESSNQESVSQNTRSVERNNPNSISTASSFLRDEYSSDDDEDNSADEDDDSIENELQTDEEIEQEMLSGAVSAVSALLASVGRDSNSSNIPRSIVTDEVDQLIVENNISTSDKNAPDESAISPELFAVGSRAVIANSSLKVSPTSSGQHISRRRFDDGLNKSKFSDLSEKERSTAHDLVEKYRSRDREFRNHHAVPRLLNESLTVSPHNSPIDSTSSYSPIVDSDSVPLKSSSEFSPEKIMPLKAPLGLYEHDRNHPEVQLTESSLSRSLEYRERMEMENNVLTVQRKFDRSIELQPPSPNRKLPASSPRIMDNNRKARAFSSSCHDRREDNCAEACVPVVDSIPAYASSTNLAAHGPEFVGTNFLGKEITPAVHAPRKPSLISRLKRAVSFSEKSASADNSTRDKKSPTNK